MYAGPIYLEHSLNRDDLYVEGTAGGHGTRFVCRTLCSYIADW